MLPKPCRDDLGWGKSPNKCSAPLESLQNPVQVVLCEADWKKAKCAKLSSTQHLAVLKNQEYKTDSGLFNVFVYYIIVYVFIHSPGLFGINLVPWISSAGTYFQTSTRTALRIITGGFNQFFYPDLVDDTFNFPSSVLCTLQYWPLFRMALCCATLPWFSSVEQFQRWSLSWCWHSWMATWMPCSADAVMSGLLTHSRIWRLLRPANRKHTALGVRTGSPATLGPGMSLHKTLEKSTMFVD